MTERGSFHGTMTFMWSNDPGQCICCPGGKHIFSRGLKLDGEWINTDDMLYRLLYSIPEGSEVTIKVFVEEEK